MEGNDLGGWYTKRQVVIFEPLLVEPPEEGFVMKAAAHMLGATKRGAEFYADRFSINTQMCTWIIYMGRQYSMPTEVWSFLPESVFNLLQPKVDRLCGDYIVEWNLWATIGEAYHALRANPDIVTVYDADEDRVERYWHFRGTRVPKGACP